MREDWKNKEDKETDSRTKETTVKGSNSLCGGGADVRLIPSVLI